MIVHVTDPIPFILVWYSHVEGSEKSSGFGVTNTLLLVIAALLLLNLLVALIHGGMGGRRRRHLSSTPPGRNHDESMHPADEAAR
jgi:hypothetical protein